MSYQAKLENLKAAVESHRSMALAHLQKGHKVEYDYWLAQSSIASREAAELEAYAG